MIVDNGVVRSINRPACVQLRIRRSAIVLRRVRHLPWAAVGPALAGQAWQVIPMGPSVDLLLLRSTLARRGSMARGDREPLPHARAGALLADRERQTRHLAGTIHDHVQQRLAAAQLHLHDARSLLEPSRQREAEALDLASSHVAHALSVTRYVRDALLPSALDDLGLVDGLLALKSRHEIATGTPVHADDLDPKAAAMLDDRPSALLMYRVAEAALGAFARDDLPGPARLTLWRFGAAGVALQVSCAQPMHGREPAQLQALRDWARDLHGDVRLRVDRSGGTVITATLDLAADAQVHGRAASADADLLELFHQLPVGVVRTDAGGRIEMINPAAARMLLPLVHPRPLDNLLDALTDCWPALRARLGHWLDEADTRLEGRCRGADPRSADDGVEIVVLRGPGGGWLALLQPVRA